jgi:hypothetical protein
MKYFLFLLTGFFITASATAFSAEGACDGVQSILNKSRYFKNIDQNGNTLGYVFFDSTPVGKWMMYSYNTDSAISSKSDNGLVAGRVDLEVSGAKCIFIVEAIRKGLLGHNVTVKGNSIEFAVSEDDKDAFFKSSLLEAITDKTESDEISKRFNLETTGTSLIGSPKIATDSEKCNNLAIDYKALAYNRITAILSSNCSKLKAFQDTVEAFMMNYGQVAEPISCLIVTSFRYSDFAPIENSRKLYTSDNALADGSRLLKAIDKEKKVWCNKKIEL